MSLPAKVRPIKVASPTPDLYHGVPILPLRVDDPIPIPRAPERYAVRIYPDLARYLLSFNPEGNRNIKPRTVARYVGDMRDGHWPFTPEAIVFTTVPSLANGQHRLCAAAEFGGDVWMMLDVGWPATIINAIDRGEKRTNADALTIDRIPHASRVAAAIALLEKYEHVIAQGGARSFTSLPTPSSQRTIARYNADPEGWAEACRAGERVYWALDKGFGTGVWVTAHRLIADVYPDLATRFLDAVADGTDPAGSASRQLGDWARRRQQSATRTGDAREPLEVTIRAFNAWRTGRSMAFPKTAGFVMSRVK